MDHKYDLVIQGIPERTPDTVGALCRSRLYTAVSDLLNKTRLQDVKITVGTPARMIGQNASPSLNTDQTEQNRPGDDQGVEVRARQYKAQRPLYTFDQLVVSDILMEDLLSAVEVTRVEKLVFDEWGLRKIEPFPRTSLNFFGPPGTGKTLAAHALAHNLGRTILIASYAEIESKFHGDGPKNVKAIFYAAERDNAVLFIDEADSLLSRRLTEVTQGSEQAINSMRSQLFICLQEFRGVVIFATNLVENYDKAFETRVRNLNFPLPDEKCRREIWRRHLVPELPLSSEIPLELLVDKLAVCADDICGRDIKNAVIDTAVRVARHGKKVIAYNDLLHSVDRIRTTRVTFKANDVETRPLAPEEKAELTMKIQAALSNEAYAPIEIGDTATSGQSD